ncbi:hypothetical protein [Candidatus Ichthyocystis sparus]|uniref:hypothetical protein n=1 Tax=Candidatus Ichthyocystis sparus TaxID=1561004 RepID=UPI000A6E50E0|nr:hypothetical protein [Candidatus Ichthyocystis sparus]
MFYNDSKCLDYSTRRNFECQSNDEVETESDCTTVVFTEHKKNSRSAGSYYSFNGSLSSSCMGASLAIISTLEGVNGENVGHDYISSKLCEIGRDLCKIIIIVPSEVDQFFIRSAFDYGLSRLGIQEKAFNFSFPLHLPRVDSDNDPTRSALLKQLSGIGSYINRYLADYDRPGIDFGISKDYMVCKSDATKFCDDDNSPNISNFVSCCNSIKNYIDYPFTQLATEESYALKTTVSNFMSSVVTESTTVDTDTINTAITLASSTTNSAVKELILGSTSEIIKSTTMVPEATNSTTAVVTSSVMKSTSMAPEVIDQTTIGLPTLISTKITLAGIDINMLTILFIVFLFIVFAILSFLGCRSCKNNKSRQPISQNVNVNVNVRYKGEGEDHKEEVEDLV